jgi:large subunit ribosomal protein L1
MGTKKNVDMSAKESKVKIVTPEPEKKIQTKKKTKKIKNKPRSKKYRAVRSKVDKSKQYDPFSAIELVKKLSYSEFVGTITAHLELRKKGLRFNLELPHSTGKKLNVAIVDEKVIEKIKEGNIDFDVLLCHPKDMSKITKYARILGPQGLMPNPKAGTLTPNPKLKKEELESGVIQIKTERKAPLIHIVIGKTDMPTKELTENLQAIIKTVNDKLKKLSIAATMSPGIKIKFS